MTQDPTEQFEPGEPTDTSAEEYQDALGAAWEDDNGTVTPAISSDPIAAPEHWSEADRGAFDDLPDEAKGIYLDKVRSLESGYNQKFEAIANERKNYEALQHAFEASGIENLEQFVEATRNNDTLGNLFEPFAEQLQAANQTPQQYVRQLVQVAQSIQAHPRETLLWLAEQHGVDLRQEAAATVQEEMTAREWATFEASHLGADRLKTHIGTHLANDPQRAHETVHAALTRAYDTVKSIDPDVRRVEDQSRQQEQMRRQDLQKARAAGRTVNAKSTPINDTRAPKDTWKSELEANWDQ